jgi:phytoene desaturase
MKKKIVVIGSGLGGLAAALRLAAAGHEVTLCEQGPTFGGKMNCWTEQGFRFDTGPSLITMPWIFREIFAAAGSRLEDHLQLVPVSPICEYLYPDGTNFNYSAMMPEWLETVRNLDRRDVEGFMKFMRLGAQLYELSRDTFLRYRPEDWPGKTDLGSLRHLPWRYGWGNYHRTVAAHFRSPHLQQLYDRYPTYVGSCPYRSPATFALIPYIEFMFGDWYIMGGLYRLVESLLTLARQHRVTLLNNSEVVRIENSGRRVTGVRLADGGHLPADVVVMNGDASHAPRLLGETGAPTELTPRERSMSGLVFLLGIRRTMPRLNHHAVFFSSDYRNEFDDIFARRRFPAEPTVYVNAPSRSDRSLVPGEGETLFIMANSPANDDDPWDDAQIAEARRRVFSVLRRGGFPDIESDVVVSNVYTPRKIGRNYLMPGGAIYGTHSHNWKNAFLRPPNKDRRYRGLYYVGGSTHPGGGTPIVLTSARIVTELIARYE